MSHYSFRTVAVLGAAAIALGAALATSAQSQVRASPSVLPVGVSASGSGSAAWFHDPSSSRVIACQLTAGVVQCQAAKLPQEGP